MTCTHNCGSCQCSERAELIAALERMGFVRDEDSDEGCDDYTRDDLPMVISLEDDDYCFYIPSKNDYRHQLDKDDVLSAIRPYQIREAIADYLRTTIGAGLAVDGELVGVDDLVAALEG